jgi:hypothetical protein
VARAFLDVWHDHVWMGLARAPGLEASLDAPRNQGTAGFEFGVLRVINEDGALEEDAITLPSFDPDAGGLYHDAVRLYGHQRHPSSWQAGLDGNATQQRNLDANPDPHRRNTPGSRCKPLDVSGRVCR